MGDGRTYDYVCALRAVTSTDGMTARRRSSSPATSCRGSRRGSSTRCTGINRVIYDYTSKPPGTIEWE